MLFMASCGTNREDVDWAITGFVKPEGENPIIYPDSISKFYCPMLQDSVKWEEGATFNPAAVKMNGNIIVIYRAEDDINQGIGSRTSRLGYARSVDGIHFQRMSAPVFYPDIDNQKDLEWPGGCEDPRIAVTEDGTYVMMYTQWNRDCPRLAVATSKDLLHWQKHGPAFAKAYNGKFCDIPTKSASIVTKLYGDAQIIEKVNGKYMMYWGEQFVNIATSDDLINWMPEVDSHGDLVKVMEPRKGYFDSQLTECGPPAIITKDGIILIYNGKNLSGEGGSKEYAAGTYCAGQALFDLHDPSRLLKRLDKPFLTPEYDFERTGQYAAGTVFTEGMAYSEGKWFIYYGCADSRVGVAVRDNKNIAI
ncbi:MAG: glycoside hydrolase family 130 protein [Bacteroidales bacterium]|nr:glycoside hydrolase family 130 protein [Bacteroidales bacterium]MCI2134960.1 glycoside hydrolase family 130 protein [Bacteroidales bacterium]